MDEKTLYYTIKDNVLTVTRSYDDVLLKDKTFRIKDTGGGGLCLFYAFLSSGDEEATFENAMSLRGELLEYLKNKTDGVESLVFENNGDLEVQGIGREIQRLESQDISNSSNWPTSISVQCLAELKNKMIVLFFSGEGSGIQIIGNNRDDVVYIISFSNNHFQWLQPIEIDGIEEIDYISPDEDTANLFDMDVRDDDEVVEVSDKKQNISSAMKTLFQYFLDNVGDQRITMLPFMLKRRKEKAYSYETLNLQSVLDLLKDNEVECICFCNFFMQELDLQWENDAKGKLQFLHYILEMERDADTYFDSIIPSGKTLDKKSLKDMPKLGKDTTNFFKSANEMNDTDVLSLRDMVDHRNGKRRRQGYQIRYIPFTDQFKTRLTLFNTLLEKFCYSLMFNIVYFEGYEIQSEKFCYQCGKTNLSAECNLSKVLATINSFKPEEETFTVSEFEKYTVEEDSEIDEFDSSAIQSARKDDLKLFDITFPIVRFDRNWLNSGKHSFILSIAFNRNELASQTNVEIKWIKKRRDEDGFIQYRYIHEGREYSFNTKSYALGNSSLYYNTLSRKREKGDPIFLQPLHLFNQLDSWKLIRLVGNTQRYKNKFLQSINKTHAKVNIDERMQSLRVAEQTYRDTLANIKASSSEKDFQRMDTMKNRAKKLYFGNRIMRSGDMLEEKVFLNAYTDNKEKLIANCWELFQKLRNSPGKYVKEMIILSAQYIFNELVSLYHPVGAKMDVDNELVLPPFKTNDTLRFKLLYMDVKLHEEPPLTKKEINEMMANFVKQPGPEVVSMTEVSLDIFSSIYNISRSKRYGNEYKANVLRMQVSRFFLYETFKDETSLDILTKPVFVIPSKEFASVQEYATYIKNVNADVKPTTSYEFLSSKLEGSQAKVMSEVIKYVLDDTDFRELSSTQFRNNDDTTKRFINAFKKKDFVTYESYESIGHTIFHFGLNSEYLPNKKKKKAIRYEKAFGNLLQPFGGDNDDDISFVDITYGYNKLTVSDNLFYKELMYNDYNNTAKSLNRMHHVLFELARMYRLIDVERARQLSDDVLEVWYMAEDKKKIKKRYDKYKSSNGEDMQTYAINKEKASREMFLKRLWERAMNENMLLIMYDLYIDFDGVQNEDWKCHLYFLAFHYLLHFFIDILKKSTNQTRKELFETELRLFTVLDRFREDFVKIERVNVDEITSNMILTRDFLKEKAIDAVNEYIATIDFEETEMKMMPTCRLSSNFQQYELTSTEGGLATNKTLGFGDYMCPYSSLQSLMKNESKNMNDILTNYVLGFVVLDYCFSYLEKEKEEKARENIKLQIYHVLKMMYYDPVEYHIIDEDDMKKETPPVSDAGYGFTSAFSLRESLYVDYVAYVMQFIHDEMQFTDNEDRMRSSILNYWRVNFSLDDVYNFYERDDWSVKGMKEETTEGIIETIMKNVAKSEINSRLSKYDKYPEFSIVIKKCLANNLLVDVGFFKSLDFNMVLKKTKDAKEKFREITLFILDVQSIRLNYIEALQEPEMTYKVLQKFKSNVQARDGVDGAQLDRLCFDEIKDMFNPTEYNCVFCQTKEHFYVCKNCKMAWRGFTNCRNCDQRIKMKSTVFMVKKQRSDMMGLNKFCTTCVNESKKYINATMKGSLEITKYDPSCTSSRILIRSCRYDEKSSGFFNFCLECYLRPGRKYFMDTNKEIEEMDIVYLMSKWDEQLNRRMARKKNDSKSVLALFQKNKKAYYNLFYVYTHCLKTSGNILCPRIMDRWSNGAKQWQDENGEYKIFTTNEEDASAASLSISKGPAKKKRRRRAISKLRKTFIELIF